MTILSVHAAAEGIYHGQSIDRANPGFWTAEVCHITGDIDFDRLVDAIVDTVRDADALHARFIERSGKLEQVIDPAAHWQPEIVRLPDATSWEQVRQAAIDRIAVPADVSAGGLFGITLFCTDTAVWWLTRAHHIVLDGYGYGLIYRQVSRRYRGNLRATDKFGRLADFVAADARSRRDVTKDREHWRQRLADVTIRGFADGVTLPSAKPLSHRQRLSGAPMDRSGSGWPHRLMAATAAALHRHTGESTVVVGVPVADRLGTAAANVPAMVMNIAALPIQVDPADRLDELEERVAETLRRDRPHHRYRYERLRRDRGTANDRLFGAVVNVIPFGDAPRLPGAEVTLHPVTAGPVDDLVITARDPNGFTVEANPKSYTSQRLQAIAEDITALLSHDGPVGRWEVLPTEPATAPIDWLDRLHTHAETRPDETALVDGERHWTWARLAEAVERVAAGLTDRGVEPGDLIALRLPRSAEAVIAMLAAGRVGCGYLPLDPDGATERNRRIIAEARPRLLIDGELPVAAGPPSSHRKRSPDDTAYVIYTSGSTGAPKGVAVSHSALSHFLGAADDRYRFQPTDRILQFAPLHFDAHVEEVFATVAAGATLVLRDDSATESLEAFIAFVDRRQVTVLDLPTAYWHELVLALDNGLVQLPPSVHTVIIGGEAADATRVAQWHSHAGDRVRLLNTYGPTETTVVCLAAQLAPGEPVEIGRPLRGVSAAIGTGGELHIAGPTLATGYLGGIGTDRFIQRDGTRWYRTGDVVERHGDTLRFVGRFDDEVKISGHRIHLSEVEAALLRCDGVDEAAVVFDAHRSRPIAYVTGRAESPALHTELSRQLPAVALPAAIAVLDRLPRNPSGKIDRRRLPDVDVAVGDAPPRTGLEQEIHDVFAEVLGVAAVDVHADFFALGGTSLAAVAAASRLSTALTVPVTAAQVFEQPTVTRLAAALSGAAPTQDRFDRDRRWKVATGLGTAPDDRILLTGATGFVGAHVLATLLGRTTRPITCLGRGGITRLRQAAADLGLPPPDDGRVDVMTCDFTQPGLGLSDSDRGRLVGTGDVIHCAAQVSLNRGYDSLRMVNVVATGDLLRLAYEGGSRFHHVSTVAVSGGIDLPEDFITAHEGLRDGYQRSKWVAEELVRQAGEAGLPAACYRLGRVAAADGGPPNPADLIGRLIAASDLLGMLPDLPIEEPHIAADTAAEAITSLVLDRALGVWNLAVDAPIVLTDALKRLRPDLPVVDLGLWRARLASLRDREAATVAAFFALRDDGPPPTAPRIGDHRFRRWWRAR